MRAYVDRHLKRGFRLDSSRLTRLNDIFVQHVGAIGEPVYSVYREDGAMLPMNSIAEIVSEPNDNTHRITRLVVSSAETAKVALKLDFRAESKNDKKDRSDKDTGAHLNAEADAREDLMPVVNDTIAFLEKDVCTVWRPSPQNVLTGLFVVVVFAQFIPLVRMMRPPTAVTAQLNAALDASDPGTKLDALLTAQLRTLSSSSYSMPLMLGLMGSMVVVLLVTVDGIQRAVWDFFWPTNLFLIGDEAERQDKRASLRDKVLWGIVIALLVSIVSAVLVSRLRIV